MKKIISLIAVALFTTATFAQDNKMQAQPAKADAKMGHECYMMKDGALMHCTGDKATAQKETVTLKNGTTIMADGTMKMKDGKAGKLTNGQCITAQGVVGDCDKMHMGMKGASKMPDQKPTPAPAPAQK
jgi:hypothetical protein